MTERYDTLNEKTTVLNLYYRAVTGRFYTEEEVARIFTLLLRTVSPISEADVSELTRLTREYNPDHLTLTELRNLRLMFSMAEEKSEDEETIVVTMLDVLEAQEKEKRTYHTRVAWLRALQMERTDTAEVLFDRACLAYVTDKGEVAAELFTRAANKSLETDFWRLAGTALAELGRDEEAYAALLRYAYWNKQAAIGVPAAVEQRLNALKETLGEEAATGLGNRIDTEMERGRHRQIGF